MNLQDWIASTVKAASRENAKPFLPTVGSVDTREVRILDNVPATVSHREALQDWIAGLGFREYYFAVADDENTIIAGHSARRAEFVVIRRGPAGWSSTPIAKPSWWRLGPH